MSRDAAKNHINSDLLLEDGSIDIVAVHRNANHLRNLAIRQMVADLVHGIAHLFHIDRPHGTPARG